MLIGALGCNSAWGIIDGVTDRDVALEVDGYVDWKVNANVTVSVVGALRLSGQGCAAVNRSYVG